MRRLAPVLLLLLLLLPLRCLGPDPVSVSESVPVSVSVSATAPAPVPASAPAPAPAPGRPPAHRSPRSASHSPRSTHASRSASPNVLPSDFRVREVTVRERAGSRATIHGWLAMEKPGVLAQPLLAYELRDADGAVVRTGTFTPLDASGGSTWIGDSAGGLRRVEFFAELDLAGRTPNALPPRPWSATAHVISIVDSKTSPTDVVHAHVK